MNELPVHSEPEISRWMSAQSAGAPVKAQAASTPFHDSGLMRFFTLMLK